MRWWKRRHISCRQTTLYSRMSQIEGYLSGLALAVFVKRGGGGKEWAQRGKVLGQKSSCKTSIFWCENAKMKNNGLASSVVVVVLEQHSIIIMPGHARPTVSSCSPWKRRKKDGIFVEKEEEKKKKLVQVPRRLPGQPRGQRETQVPTRLSATVSLHPRQFRSRDWCDGVVVSRARMPACGLRGIWQIAEIVGAGSLAAAGSGGIFSWGMRMSTGAF